MKRSNGKRKEKKNDMSLVSFKLYEKNKDTHLTEKESNSPLQIAE